jgi:hypothetical protein
VPIIKKTHGQNIRASGGMFKKQSQKWFDQFKAFAESEGGSL